MPSKERILKKAIEKAVKNGFDLPPCPCTKDDSDICEGHRWEDIDDDLEFSIIFSHGFAKAFWGREWVCEKDGNYVLDADEHVDGYAECSQCEISGSDSDLIPQIKEWEFHLQTMVLQEDPLQYLAKFL